MLGAIIEAVSGQDYFEYVRQHIYQPAGMINTDAYELDRETPNLATGYTRAPGDTEWSNNLFQHVIKGGPAGGGYSTVADLFAFAQALINHELLNDEMTTLVTSPKVQTPGALDAHYGYGFIVETLNGYHRFGHSGGFIGISTGLYIYPELGYVVAVLSNYDPPAASRLAMRIGKLLTGMEIPRPIMIATADLIEYSGTYSRVGEAAVPSRVELHTEDGALWLILDGERHRFLPHSATEFYDEQFEDVRIRFDLNAQGEPTGLTVEGAGPEVIEYIVAAEGVEGDQATPELISP